MMKLLEWYCVIISTLSLIIHITGVIGFDPTQHNWYALPIFCVTDILYAIFFWLAAFNKKIPLALVYIARAINVFYCLIGLLALIYFGRKFKLAGLATVIAVLPLFYYCENKVRDILKP